MKSTTVFKMLSNPTRLRIINLLLNKKVCVCQMEEILDLKQTNISRQLLVLRENNLVLTSKVNQRIFYKVNYEAVNNDILKDLINSFEDESLNLDLVKMQNTPDEGNFVCPSEEKLWI